MSLLDKMDTFALQGIVETDDGFGGVNQSLTDGEIFHGRALLKSSTQAVIAYQQGYKQIFDLIHTGIDLHRENRVKHMKTGAIYRITSDSQNMKPPPGSDLSFAVVTCEVVEV